MAGAGAVKVSGYLSMEGIGKSGPLSTDWSTNGCSCPTSGIELTAPVCAANGSGVVE